MEAKNIFDIIGIGIGPFNLGLAAMAWPLENLKCIFFDAKEEFNWHPGLLLKHARMQVPYYADLVTLVNPRSDFSYFMFLQAKQRMLRFAVHDHLFPTRMEYNQYCQWVAGQLPNLHFGRVCETVHYNPESKCYEVSVKQTVSGEVQTFHAKHIVIGVGSEPHMPVCASTLAHPLIFHSGEYLFKKEKLLNAKNIAIIGSGQSAAEIFHDLLSYSDQLENLSWFTKSARFIPMEYSKLTLEMSTPDYIDHFYSLSNENRKSILQQQHYLYKGINFSLIDEIYDHHYIESLYGDNNTGLFTNCELKNIRTKKNAIELEFLQLESNSGFLHVSNAVILATGYSQHIPPFIVGIKDKIQFAETGFYNVNRNYSIDSDNRIFAQNADLHTHGFNSADLGLGPYRNAIILNAILGTDHFILEKNIAFQTFGVSRR
jgi:lysine N6-hydroxylase